MKLAPMNIEELTANSNPLVRSDRGVTWSTGELNGTVLMLLLHRQVCELQVTSTFPVAVCMISNYQACGKLLRPENSWLMSFNRAALVIVPGDT